MLARTGTSLLIDVAHLIITVANLYGKTNKQAVVDYLEAITDGNYQRIKEIHFLVPRKEGSQLFDCGETVFEGEVYRDAFFVLQGTDEFILAIQTLQHILNRRKNQTNEAIVVNFESNVATMPQDLEAFVASMK